MESRNAIPNLQNVQSTPASLSGRCANERELGRGVLVHAVDGVLRTDQGSLHGRALCGAKPGPRSVGWTTGFTEVTCPTCLRKMPARGY